MDLICMGLHMREQQKNVWKGFFFSSRVHLGVENAIFQENRGG